MSISLDPFAAPLALCCPIIPEAHGGGWMGLEQVDLGHMRGRTRAKNLMRSL